MSGRSHNIPLSQFHIINQKDHRFKMNDSIHHGRKNIIQMKPNFVSPESRKNIACGKIKQNWGNKKVPV